MICLDCGRVTAREHARQLCQPCWRKNNAAGTLDDYPAGGNWRETKIPAPSQRILPAQPLPSRCVGCNEPHALDHLSLVMREGIAAMLCAVCVVRVVFDLPREAAVSLSEAMGGGEATTTPSTASEGAVVS